jgi:hypothetical protein
MELKPQDATDGRAVSQAGPDAGAAGGSVEQAPGMGARTPEPPAPQKLTVEHREGILEVYDWVGTYRGCIGVDTWERLVADEERWQRRARAYGPSMKLDDQNRAAERDASGGDPAVVHPSQSHGERQAELNGPSGSPTSPPEPDWKLRVAEETLAWIADPSYVGNYAPLDVIDIHRKWAVNALEKIRA